MTSTPESSLIIRHAWESRIVGAHEAVYDGGAVKRGIKRYVITRHVCRRCGEISDAIPRPWWATVPSEGPITVQDCAA